MFLATRKSASHSRFLDTMFPGAPILLSFWRPATFVYVIGSPIVGKEGKQVTLSLENVQSCLFVYAFM